VAPDRREARRAGRAREQLAARGDQVERAGDGTQCEARGREVLEDLPVVHRARVDEREREGLAAVQAVDVRGDVDVPADVLVEEAEGGRSEEAHELPPAAVGMTLCPPGQSSV